MSIIFFRNSGSDSTILLAELFESVVTIVDQHGDDLTSSFGGAAVQTVVQSLNKVCLYRSYAYSTVSK